MSGRGGKSGVPRSGEGGNPPSPASRQGEGREVIFEFAPVGASVKVTAVDVATGTEVSVIGPALAPRHELERVALQKLRYMLDRGAAGAVPKPPKEGGTGGGILV